jgi:VanZ family protein
LLYSRCNAAGFRLLLALALLLGTWQALTPAPLAPAAVDDKLLHAAGFLLLALLTDIAWPEHGFGWRAFGALALYGALIEGLQALSATRSAELGDWLADLAGLLVFALLLGPALRRRFGAPTRRAGDAE